MKTINIDIDAETTTEIQRILRALKEVVDEAGRDYIYPRSQRPALKGSLNNSCYYVWQGKADCIVARTFEKLGLPLSLLRENTGIYGHIDVPLTPASLEVLSVAQNAQDKGETWGMALDDALENAKTTYGVTL